MAVGGMVGGGIFSVLGLVVQIAGHLAPLAFLIAGILTYVTGCSYAGLYEKFRTSGGSVAFVRHVTGSTILSGHIGWALLLGYIFTNSLYAFTFGHYLANVFGAPAWMPDAAALAITLILLVVNLVGIGESALTAMITVWGKLIILGGVAALGIMHFDATRITPLADHRLVSPLVAAAVIFISFEGFQLLAYDVDDMEEPLRNLRRAMLPAIVTATCVYIAVALACLFIVPEQALIEQKEVALAVAGTNLMGPLGLWAVTVGALFSTMSAINATLFGTARLASTLAEEGELPSWFAAHSQRGVPHIALTVIAIAGGLFALLGTIERIVTFASLMFLLVFAVVNYLFWRTADTRKERLGAGAATIGLSLALVTVAGWLAQNSMNALILSIGITVALAASRLAFVRYFRQANGEDLAAAQSVECADDFDEEPESGRETALKTRK